MRRSPNHAPPQPVAPFTNYPNILEKPLLEDAPPYCIMTYLEPSGRRFAHVAAPLRLMSK
jgi:hypothetical protein